jgi:hypothetical protein
MSAVSACSRQVTRRAAALAVSAALIGSGAGFVGSAHAAPAAGGKTGKIVVKVVKGHKRVSGLKVCPYVTQTPNLAGKCKRSNRNGIARLRHVKAGSIDLVTYKHNGNQGTIVSGIHIRAGKTKHYKLQTRSACPGSCG